MSKPVYDVVLVEDHTLVRGLLRAEIERPGTCRVSREYGDGDLFAAMLPLKPLPDVVLLDMHLPGRNGVQLLQLIRELQPQLRVLLLTGAFDEASVPYLFSLGLRGYLLKKDALGSLQEALEAVIHTGYYTRSHQEAAIASDAPAHYRTKRDILAGVTGRQLEFLKLVCDPREYIYEEIASIMCVHRRTLDGYREQLFRKFDVKSRSGLVLFVHRHGLLL